MKILNKILILLLLLTVIPLLILGSMAISDIKELQKSAETNINLIGDTAVVDSTKALNNLGEEMIKLIGVDVAKQLEIYIKDHPEMTVEDLQKDEYFSAIAVQPVGQKGYTAITDVDSLTCRFHASEKIANMDLHNLAEKLPGFWGVMAKTEGGVVSEGYYDWEDPDSSIKQKYMYISIVDARTADNVKFSVAATTYIDEFNAPAADTGKKLDEQISSVVDTLSFTASKIRSQTMMFIAVITFIVIIVGFIFANTITGPLNKLTEAGNKIADGKFDTEIPVIKTKDEIRDLGNTMTLLVGAMKFLKKGKKK